MNSGETVPYRAGAPLLAELVRNGEPIITLLPDSLTCDLTVDDAEALEDVLLKPVRREDSPFCFYYLRLTQRDGNMAWSSPIWVTG